MNALYAISVTMAVVALIIWWSTKKNPQKMIDCPSCHTSTNFLTLSGICQDCAWKEIAER